MHPFSKSVSYCHQCGIQTDLNWKFCPSCNTSLLNQNNFQVNDSVISGDLTINQTKTNITSVVTRCQNCRSEGNMIISPCKRIECSKKSCEKCMGTFDNHCGLECQGLTRKEHVEESRIRTQHERIVNEKVERMRQEEQERKRQEERIVNKRKRQEKRIVYLRESKKRRLNLFLGVVFLFLPGLVLLGVGSISAWGDTELNYICSSGDTINGGDVLDGTYDCMDGSDEDSSSENEDFRNRVDEQNKTLQTHEIYGALSCSGGIILLGFYFMINGAALSGDRIKQDDEWHH